MLRSSLIYFCVGIVIRVILVQGLSKVVLTTLVWFGLQEEWVICRIFHKNGEKKNPMMFSCESYLMESGGGCGLSSSTTSNSLQLPPLLETPTTTLIECQSQAAAAAAAAAFQNSFQINQQPPPPENDLKSLVSSVVSQSNLLSSSEAPCFSHRPSSNVNPIIANPNNNMASPSSLSSSIFFNSRQHYSDYMFKRLKGEESSFSTTHFEPTDTNNSNSFMDIKVHPNHPLFFEMDQCNSSPPPAAAAAEMSVHDISTSIAFNRSPFQTMLDPHINIVHAHGESWPLDA